MDSKYERMLLTAYKDRLHYNAQEHHIVLYGTDQLYEYNMVTHKIRPFNSIFWYQIVFPEALEFLFHLDTELDKLKSEEDSVSKSGFIVDGNVINVNLNYLAFDLLMKSPMELVYSFNQFFSLIRLLYKINQLPNE